LQLTECSHITSYLQDHKAAPLRHATDLPSIISNFARSLGTYSGYLNYLGCVPEVHQVLHVTAIHSSAQFSTVLAK